MPLGSFEGVNGSLEEALPDNVGKQVKNFDSPYLFRICERGGEKYVYAGRCVTGLYTGVWSPPATSLP